MAVGVRRGKVKLIGYVQNDEGRDVKLFARFPVNKPQHAYELTKLCLGISAETIRTGTSVDQRLADAELVINGKLHYLELDRGTMGYAEVIGRLDKYRDCQDKVLWVMSSELRIKGILERTKNLPATFLFTTYEKARQDFHQAIWTDATGITSCVERSVRVSVGEAGNATPEEGMATSRAGNPL